MSASSKVLPAKRGCADEWTRERVMGLPTRDIKQLRENAERLNEPALVTLCSEVLKLQPKARIGQQAKSSPPKGMPSRVNARQATAPATRW